MELTYRLTEVYALHDYDGRRLMPFVVDAELLLGNILWFPVWFVEHAAINYP
jgi:hypothetical protein